jgi:exosortase
MLAARNKLTAYHLVLAWVLVLLGVAVTYRAWQHIYSIASEDAEYQHVFLVPFVAAFLAWVRRGRLQNVRVTGVVTGPLLVALGWAAGSYGFNHGVQILFHTGAVLVLIGCIVSVLGKQVLFRFLPVAIVLLMIVPMPGTLRLAIAEPLQEYTAEISRYALGLFGVETQVSGQLIRINGQPVLIAEACNGMRMVLPLFLIAYGFAFGLPLRAGVRMLILCASPIVALLCNVVRVIPLVWLQGQGEMGRSWGESLHEHSGWFMVPLAFLVLLGVIKLLKWAMVPVYRYPLASQST